MSWSTPSMAYQGTHLSFPGRSSGEKNVKITYNSVIKTEPSDVPGEDYMDLHDINYIANTDIQVPQEATPVVEIQTVQSGKSRSVDASNTTESMVVSEESTGNRLSSCMTLRQ